MAGIDLAFVWMVLLAFAVLAYVLLDGFDLGIGILFPVLGDASDKTRAMNSVAPVWDGNETWLVLGGGGLFAVFPLAYAIIFPALYAPIVAMLVGLILRGVAFEFRGAARSRPYRWDRAFFAGSLLAALAQGITLGALVQGIPVEARQYAGGWWDWLTPFSVVTGLALAAGYCLLGATWLVLKTEGELQRRARVLAHRFALATLAGIFVFSIWTPFLQEGYVAKWFGWPALLYTMPVPLLVVACGALLLGSLGRGRELAPFLSACGLFVLSFIGLMISFWPHVVPNSVTFREAAAPDASLGFLLVGALVLLPLILAYTVGVYRVFRGKVRAGEGYH
jgi:cytochrome d ubiquinol oxidase subunit II